MSSRPQDRRVSLRTSREELVQRTALAPDIRSDFVAKPADACPAPLIPSDVDNGSKRDAGQPVGLSRVSPATSHLTGAVATCLVGMNPVLRSSLTTRTPQTPATDDLSDLSLQEVAGLKSAADPVGQSYQSQSQAERAVLSAISAELQLNFLEAKSR